MFRLRNNKIIFTYELCIELKLVLLKNDGILSYDVASLSEITPCNKIDKPLVVYRFSGNVMASITSLRT